MDYIDNGYTLLIHIDCGVRYFCEIEFDHSVNRLDFETAKAYDWENWDRDLPISYFIKLVKYTRRGCEIDYRNSEELRKILREMYTDEKIKT